MAFIDNDEVKKVWAELPVDVFLFFVPGNGLIEGEIDLIGLVGLPLLDLGHGRTEGLEIVGHGLVDQDVPVCEEEDALLHLGLPKPPDDLESGKGFACSCGHHQQNTVPAPDDGLHGLVDGQKLVVARALLAAVTKVVLRNQRLLLLVQAAVLRPPLPQRFRRGEFVKGELTLHNPV